MPPAVQRRETTLQRQGTDESQRTSFPSLISPDLTVSGIVSDKPRLGSGSITYKVSDLAVSPDALVMLAGSPVLLSKGKGESIADDFGLALAPTDQSQKRDVNSFRSGGFVLLF
jgi:hypothetical protein